MKKFFTIVMICMIAVVATVLTACVEDGGTTYPSTSQMCTNLEAHGYEVTVTQNPDGKNGTYLSATKNGEFIEFYWLNNADDCDYFYNKLEEIENYNVLVQIENDVTHGSIVYCATSTAVDDAGIKVVKTDVSVKV